jgi:hypothetical protein
MFKGDKLRTFALMCQVEFDTAAEKLQLRFVNIGYHMAAGHTT